MYVVKRDGRQESVHFDKITARLKKLSYGLSSEHCDPVLVAQKVCAGVYKGVTTSQLDELAAETAAAMTANHPDYASVSPSPPPPSKFFFGSLSFVCSFFVLIFSFQSSFLTYWLQFSSSCGLPFMILCAVLLVFDSYWPWLWFPITTFGSRIRCSMVITFVSGFSTLLGSLVIIMSPMCVELWI